MNGLESPGFRPGEDAKAVRMIGSVQFRARATRCELPHRVRGTTGHLLYRTVFQYHSRTVIVYELQTVEGGRMSISASEARQRLFPLLEQVNTDHEPVRITSKAGDAVLMSADDYDSWQETVYLLRSPENARRLMEAVARDKASRSISATAVKTIEELEEMAGGQG